MPHKKRHDLNGGRAYLSLGSNVGAREYNVLRAVRMLDSSVGRVMRVSSLYETTPVDCPPMNDFVNAVVEVRSLLCAEDLLSRVQELETLMGRGSGHNEPRPLDVDIIAFGERRIHTERLTIPHPRYRRRLFVLVPLGEVAPQFRCPVTRRTVDRMIEDLAPGQLVARVSSRRIRLESVESWGGLHHVHSNQRENAR